MAPKRQAAPAAARRDKSSTWWLVLAALVLATIAAYSPLIQNGFVNFDDPVYFLDNPRIFGGFSLDQLRWALVSPVVGYWHPFTILSLMLDARIFGAGPLGPHMVNLALHIANTLLLLAVLVALTGNFWRSALVAALFALHPLHVESVAWLSGRKDVLSLFFALCALAVYIRFTERRSVLRMTAVSLLFAASLLAKPTLVTFPFVLLLLDVWPLNRTSRESWWRLVLEKVPLFVLSAADAAITLAIQAGSGFVATGDVLPISGRLSNAVISYVAYLQKTVWPLSLAYYYPHPRTLRLGEASIAACVLLLLGAVAWKQRARKPYLMMGLLWFLGTLVPVIGFVQNGEQAMADRYTYLSLTGPLIALVWLAADASSAVRTESVRRFASAVGLVVLGALSVLTYRQVQTWHDTVTLAEHALAVTKDNFMAEGMLGSEFIIRGRTDDAINHLRRALAIADGSAEVHANLAIALIAKDDRVAGLAELRRAVELEPTRPDVRYRLGHFLAPDAPAEALPHLERTVALSPDYGVAHLDLGLTLVRLRRGSDGIEHLKRAAQLLPESADAQRALGLTLAEQGRIAEAVPVLKESLRLAPDDVIVLHNLGMIESSDPDEHLRNAADAVRLAERARELTHRRSATVLFGLAAAYAEAGRFEDARVVAEQARSQAVADKSEDVAAQSEYLLRLLMVRRPLRQRFGAAADNPTPDP